jgi:hypothetical protein
LAGMQKMPHSLSLPRMGGGNPHTMAGALPTNSTP